MEIFEKLKSHQEKFSSIKLNQLFEKDSERAEKYTIKYEDIYFDYSKNFIIKDTLNLLLEYANKLKLQDEIEKMFTGEKINFTENRAVLHTALRNFSNRAIYVDGEDVMPLINKVREQMKAFVHKVHSGEWVGATGEKITDVVNIGIGGSHLGPAMATRALTKYNTTGIKVHYVSNVDGEDIAEVLNKINPASTLFIIASKTFTTLETMKNAQTAKNWFLKKFARDEKDVSKHFIALSTNKEACIKFGINPENMFAFWDWVGGRYSLWSAIGLSIALAIGWENFEELLRGAYEIDRHFRSTPFENNIPVIYALLDFWYSTFWKFTSKAIIPYSHYLALFPAFLQQLEMESNGKYIDRAGSKVNYNTCRIVWGEVGTNSQHSFFQLLHQGTEIVPVDFIGFVNPIEELGDHHDWLLSNMFAQAEALMIGKDSTSVEKELQSKGYEQEKISKLLPHKIFEGNRPSNIFLIDKLTPKSLGKLISIYEHKVFVLGILWQINSFDQWGVELGKELAQKIYNDIQNQINKNNHDSSTKNLLNYYKMKKK
ncbi:MAG: glucose-6-phosphate isomerase [Candidatus Kapaibacteriota bacterium]